MLFALVLSCNSDRITNPADYEAYLNTKIEPTKLLEDANFWSNKMARGSSSYTYLISRANAYTKVFDQTGQIEYLIKAESDLLEANTIVKDSDAGLLKSLASNYISQHRFKEALDRLKKAESNGEKLIGTKKMLFDVHLELGNYIHAEAYLKDIKNPSDFDYLIRLAKWEDHQGNLEAAIENMEKATAIAESSNLKGIKQWAYTNSADFYGHAGNIQKSYDYFLKALALDPNDAYAKKGIAWILFSHENNPDEALRLLDHITGYYQAPDYHLLKAEVAEFQNNLALKDQALQDYRKTVSNKDYGTMYNGHDITLYTDELSLPERAIDLAKIEVENRPTPQAYDLLAWSYFKNGNVEKATSIIETYVDGKTFEPAVLYHIAEIYKAAGKPGKVRPLKEELMASIYELGPLMETKINQL